MVKELELEPSGDVWIVLNLHAAVQRGDGRGGTLEYAIILAASMAAEMVSGRERRAVGLLTASGNEVVALPPQPGQAQLWAIMAALAPAQPTSWPLAEAAAPQHERTRAAAHLDRHHAGRNCNYCHAACCCPTCGVRNYCSVPRRRLRQRRSHG